MGTTTNNHIAAVNSELGKLKAAITTVNSSDSQFTATWHSMMAAYDKPQGGKSASVGFRAKLLTEATNHDTALKQAQTHYADTETAVTLMHNYLVQKDASTINIFKKKSLGKANRFVTNVKAALKLEEHILTTAELTPAFNIGRGIYY